MPQKPWAIGHAITSTDCGWGTFAGSESVVWAKLRALREGADLRYRAPLALRAGGPRITRSPCPPAPRRISGT
jgi:hypothetical protein